LFWSIIGGVVLLLWGAALVVRLTPPYRHLHDFVQEWTSARNHSIGEPIYMSMRESIPLHFGRPYDVILDVNAHPPAAVLVSLPFCKLSYAAAYFSWNIASLVCLAISLWLLIRPAGLDFSAWAILPLTSILLVGNPLAQQVNQGQLNLLLLLIITAAWATMRAERLEVSGFLVGVATAIKLFPGFLALYFAYRRQWSGVAFSVVGFVALNVLTGAVLGWECYSDYFRTVVPRVSEFRDFWPNASIAGFYSKLLDGASGHVIPLVKLPQLAQAATVVGALAVVGLVAWKCLKAKSQGDCDLAFGLCIVAMLLVSPITWDHYFLLLLLPLAILWKVSPATMLNRCAILAAAVVLSSDPKLIWDATIPGDGELVFTADQIASVAQPWHTLTVVSYQFYALLALFVFAYRATARPSSGSQD
jgi:hypothetical protein